MTWTGSLQLSAIPRFSSYPGEGTDDSKAPIGAWECSFHAHLENYDRPSTQPMSLVRLFAQVLIMWNLFFTCPVKKLIKMILKGLSWKLDVSKITRLPSNKLHTFQIMPLITWVSGPEPSFNFAQVPKFIILKRSLKLLDI